MRTLRLKSLLITAALLALALAPVTMAQVKPTKIVAYVDGEKLLEHTFEDSMYIPGRMILVPYNGVVRFDDVKITAPSGEVLFADDFETENLGDFPSKWQRDNAGGWTIVADGDNKVLEQSDANLTGMSDLWPRAAHFNGGAEYTVEFKYQLISWNGTTYRMNFIPRGENRNNAYMIQYHLRDELLTIAHRASGGDNRIVASPFEIEPGRWYDFRIDVSLVD